MDANLVLNNGQTIPRIGLGTFLGKELENVVKISLDVGYRLIDTANVYKNEEQIGRAINEKLKEGKIKREDLFIVSKVWNDHHDPEKLISSIENSLQQLQLDYLDLFLIHWPFATVGVLEDNISLEETWKAMEDCVTLGYTKSIGVSNFNSVQIERILKIAIIKPVVNQVECNVYMNQEKLEDFCQQRDITLMGSSPFYGTETCYGVDHHGLNMFQEPIVKKLSKKYKKTAAQIILRYLVQQGIVPIPKSDKPRRIKENFDIFNFSITPEDMKEMRSLNKNLRCIDFSAAKYFKEYPFNIEF